MKLTNTKILKSSTWPPGTVMRFQNARFIGLGIVVANDCRKTIVVLWDGACSQSLCVYDVTMLNPEVISRDN